MTKSSTAWNRRQVLSLAARLGVGASAPGLLGVARAQAPGVVGSDSNRPRLDYGLQFGDPRLDHSGRAATGVTASAIVWTRADRPCRWLAEWSLDPSFRNVQGAASLALQPSDDCTGRIELIGLPPGQRIFVRSVAHSIDGTQTASEPVEGSFTTPATDAVDIRFVWGGDTAGQGWGISPNYGGMMTYRTMLEQQPHFFVHSGDTIYADGPIVPEQAVAGSATWRNIVTPEKSKVAETLEEFRGNYRYNLMDHHVQAFNHGVAQIWQWDDHEVTNNWSDSKDLQPDPRYREKSVALLSARATRAFREYAPMRAAGDVERDRVYRRLYQGPLLELFMVDMRSYRGPNSANVQGSYDRDSWFLGPRQLAWLENALKSSTAVWKVICADMPIGLQVADGRTPEGQPRWEAIANGLDGPPLGREQEIARLLASIRRHRVRNVVWLTADVH